MKDRKITEEESWDLIHQMISVAKEDHHVTGITWLLWGWMLFGASILSLVFAYLNWWSYISWAWTGMLLLGSIVYTFARLRQKEQQMVKTYVQELLQKFGTGFFISLFVIIASTGLDKSGFSFGYFYVLYAFWMFIHGSAIRFRPLIIGAVVNWAAAIAIFIIQDFKYDMMISAVAVMAGYLVPGYMLQARNRKKIPS